MRPLVLKGHSKPIKDLMFNKDNDLLFSASTDRFITLWSAEYGERIGTYSHSAAVYTMDITKNSEFLVSGDSTGVVYFWETQTGSLLKKIELDPSFSIRSVNFNYGDDKISFSYGGRKKEAESGVLIYDFSEILNGKTNDKQIIQNVKPEKTLKAEKTEKITKSKWMNLNENMIVTTESGNIISYDIKTEKPILTKQVHEGIIMDFDISKKEEVILTASKDGKSHVLDPDTFDIIQTFFPQDPTRLINSCRISPLMSLDEEDKERYHCFIAGGQESRDVTTTHAKKGGFELLIYNMMYGNELGAIQGHFGPINSVAISGDGMILATGAEEASVRVQKLNYDEYLTLDR